MLINVTSGNLCSSDVILCIEFYFPHVDLYECLYYRNNDTLKHVERCPPSSVNGVFQYVTAHIRQLNVMVSSMG
jgi:hypothetical protein